MMLIANILIIVMSIVTIIYQIAPDIESCITDIECYITKKKNERVLEAKVQHAYEEYGDRIESIVVDPLYEVVITLKKDDEEENKHD